MKAKSDPLLKQAKQYLAHASKAVRAKDYQGADAAMRLAAKAMDEHQAQVRKAKGSW